MEHYSISGMSCAACSASVEKAVSAVEGVESCNVSLLTNSMSVEGSASESDIIKAVEKAGYGAKKKGKSGNAAQEDDELLKDTETPLIRNRLIKSLVVLSMLMYFQWGAVCSGFLFSPALKTPFFRAFFKCFLP